MSIPLKIAEKGGDTLEKYIKTEISIKDKKTRLAEVELIIKLNMLSVDDLIGDFMPERKDPYVNNPHWFDNNFRVRKITLNMKENRKVALNFMMTEEILKNIRPLILEMKGLELEITKLKRLQELREQGK